ncbi:MAG: thiopurine S-methyltransferase [Mesorhizobium sp.]
MSHSDFGLEFWHAQWAKGGSAFTAGERGRLVATHWPSLGVPAGGKVLVPLAGKSPDMAWLAGEGFDVVGVEISPIACETFFSERHLDVQRVKNGPFLAWKGGGVTILQGDFFDLCGSYAAVLDRGGLVALPSQCRLLYAERLKRLLEPDGAMLLVTIEYDSRRRRGPPFPVFPDEVRDLFPGSHEQARQPLDRPRWTSIGGADAVVWVTKGKPRSR